MSSTTLQLKRSLGRLLRKFKYSSSWHWFDLTQLDGGLKVGSLLAPLRYDIVIRKDFLGFYEANKSLYLSDFNSFLNLALKHAYFLCVTTRYANLVVDESAMMETYARRIRRFIAVHESILQNGFDKSFPLVLTTGMEILPTLNGKCVSGQFFMGNGCHRLACLMHAGYETIPLEFIRIKCFPRLQPIDGMVDLVHKIPLAPQTYFAFLSQRYVHSRKLESEAELIAHLTVEAPDKLPEVKSVINADGMSQLDTDKPCPTPWQRAAKGKRRLRQKRNPTIGTLIDQYFDYHEKRQQSAKQAGIGEHLSEETLQQYRWVIERHIRPYWGEWLIGDVIRSDIKAYIQDLTERQGHSYFDANNVLQRLNGLMRFALDEEYIEKNPCEYVAANLKM